MEFTSAICTIEGIAPYSQSHKHDEPYKEGETHDDYDRRTWRSKMNVELIAGKRTMVIPAFGIHDALTEAAKHSGMKVPNAPGGKSTFTAKFKSGIAMMGSATLNVDPETVECVPILVNADGRRGSGARVLKRFPQIPAGWKAKFEVIILDPVITEPVFTTMLERAGIYIGVGQYRPINGGSNGRWQVIEVKWTDNRRFVPKAA